MAGRIKRSRPDMSKRKKNDKTISNNSSNISQFSKTVARNEDYFNFINARDCAMRDMYIQAQLDGITEFTMLMYIYGLDGSVATYPFVYKSAEVKVMLKQGVELLAGDRLRFDIQGIDSVYDKITNMGIGFMLNYGKN